MFSTNDASARNRRSISEVNKEVHSHTGCKYKYLQNWIENDTLKRVFVMVRVCKCKMHESKEEYLRRKEIYLFETGVNRGVDVHNYDGQYTENCEWIKIINPDGSITLRRSCTCTRK
ncbi:hypothetical protein ACJMK2_017394 [Sinanodonta woodiana]|uniref:Uncharacterized protein n=1 Tax=Sinanodonta woodiana TaxID=1069815 RepID=A0ABD3UCY5_SINWO